jgi:hypothetical protein
MQCVCGAVGAGGWVRAAASPSVLTNKLLQEKTKFIRVRPLCRSQYEKTARRGILRLFRTTLEKRRQKGKFFRRQKFALLHIKATKITKFQWHKRRKFTFIFE